MSSTGSDLFDRSDRDTGIAQHVFPGRLMPSHHLVRQFGDIFTAEKDILLERYALSATSNDWLANFDAHRDAIEASLRKVECSLAASSARHVGPVRVRRWSRMDISHYPMRDANQLRASVADRRGGTRFTIR